MSGSTVKHLKEMCDWKLWWSREENKKNVGVYFKVDVETDVFQFCLSVSEILTQTYGFISCYYIKIPLLQRLKTFSNTRSVNDLSDLQNTFSNCQMPNGNSNSFKM